MLALGMNAQVKKSWDFTKGLSDETIENLNADATHWAENGTDADGVVNNWKNIGKPDANSYLMANGVVIPETFGLLIDIGSNKDNSIHLATTKMRLTRKTTKITFPKLANGQKMKVVGRSANGTATNRGIAPVQNHLVFQPEESSPQTGGACIFVGNQVEGSEGTYTFVWKVVTEEADSVDVQFQLTPDGGIDFTLFQIDEGDAPEVKKHRRWHSSTAAVMTTTMPTPSSPATAASHSLKSTSTPPRRQQRRCANTRPSSSVPPSGPTMPSCLSLLPPSPMCPPSTSIPPSMSRLDWARR